MTRDDRRQAPARGAHAAAAIGEASRRHLRVLQEGPPPRFEGEEHLSFRCTHCGNCCTETIVPVTTADVVRLSRAIGLRPDKIISFYPPTSFLQNGHGLPFARLDVGPRIMALAQKGDQTCKFHRDERCTVYADRPVVCRTFPFSIALGARREVARLSIAEAPACLYEPDGQVEWPALERACRWDLRQDVAWQSVIDGWNERWAGSSRAEFLTYVGL